MNILFISGYAGWGEKFALIGDKLINNNEINKYDVITQGLDSYENLKNMEMKGNHIVFENTYKQFLDSPEQQNIEQLEKKYGSLYKIASSDRTLVQFTHPLNYGKDHNKNFLVNYVAFWLNYFEEYFIKNKTDFVITSVIASCMPLAAALVTKKNKLKLLNLGGTRFPDRTCFFSDIYISERTSYARHDSSHANKALEFLDKVIEKNKSEPSWSKWRQNIANPLDLRNYFRFFKYNSLYSKYKHYFGLDNFKDPIIFIPSIRLRLEKYILKVFRSMYFRNIKKTNDFSKNDFYLYALHVDPEMATSVLALEWIDQLDLIKRIRINMPHNRTLLVKEHPTMIGVRNINFYKDLMKIPGVEICSETLPTVELIKKSKLVISVTGTICFEASLYNKASFLFSKTDFSKLSSISVFDGNLDNLDQQLFNAENNSLQNSELIDLLAENYANSVDITGEEIWDSEVKFNLDFIEKMTNLISLNLRSN